MRSLLKIEVAIHYSNPTKSRFETAPLISSIRGAKRYLFDAKTKHRNPLSKPDILQKSLQIHSIHKKNDIICLALDKTLVSLTTKPPPKDQLSYRIQVSQINGQTVRHYITPRPFLKEFLDVVT